jgi:hypothetical protein
LAKAVLPPETIEGIIATVDLIDDSRDLQALASLLRADRREHAAAAPAEASAH